MKGLLKFLAPFAPDQSGAVCVLYELGGIIVICDAGGCTGNICGFDEPRWFRQKSAVFSAGLRDMDAILGRDERLVEKLADAAGHLDASFAALIGTPVPAVIATDFGALGRMAGEMTGLPVIAVECTGTRLYDEGARDAWLELFRTFSGEVSERKNLLGVIGCTPLDISRADAGEGPGRYAREHGYYAARCYGMGAGLEEIEQAGSVSENLVVSPAGIAAAEYLKEKFGTPYGTGYPFFDKEFKQRLRGIRGKRILIVHQQVAANEIRDIITDGICGGRAGLDVADISASRIEAAGGNIVCGTWFLQIPELARPQDVRFEREDEFIAYVENGGFDVVIGDPAFKRALRGFSGEYIDCPHFAVSGLTDCAD